MVWPGRLSTIPWGVQGSNPLHPFPAILVEWKPFAWQQLSHGVKHRGIIASQVGDAGKATLALPPGSRRDRLPDAPVSALPGYYGAQLTKLVIDPAAGHVPIVAVVSGVGDGMAYCGWPRPGQLRVVNSDTTYYSQRPSQRTNRTLRCDGRAAGARILRKPYPADCLCSTRC